MKFQGLGHDLSIHKIIG